MNIDEINQRAFLTQMKISRCGTLFDITYKNSFLSKEIEKNKDIIDKCEFIVFYTNWSKYWNTEKYLYKYPIMSDEVAEFIVSSKKKGVAFDTISVDTIDSLTLPNHHKLLSNNVVF